MKPFPPSCLLLCCSSYIISLPWIGPVHLFPAHLYLSLSIRAFLSLSLHMAEEEEASCIKLFGAVIVKRDREAKEEEEAPQQALPGAGAVEAAEAAARGAAALPCPRCKSRETKFCYFNNYNVNQPRHFCKACHRYWTAGGALRNVPVGAGRRRGRPSHRVGVGGGGGGVLEYPSAGCLGGAAAERWLLRPEAPARVDRGIDGGLR